jgi:predicted transglutaminase-like cysteine proteinase
MCLNRLLEAYTMLGFTRAIIVEEDKRPRPINVTEFFTRNDSRLLDIVKGWANLFEEKKVEAAFNWVLRHITYREKSNAFWNMPDETLDTCSGVCEDGAILLANLLVYSGVPFWKVLICVYDNVHHVVVTYKGKLLDWTNPEHTVVPNGVLWYCFNAKRAYTFQENVDKWKR